jgi:multiple sugar transport system ATP-binding protein
MMASVTLKNISKNYNSDVQVIQSVDLVIADGEFVVFVGPSGCGKSTLLRMIAGLEEISGGDIHIGEVLANEVHASERGIAMVFQSYALYPHMSVEKNMGFALKMAGMSKAEVAHKVKQAAEILQMTHLLERKPKELSGGQRQRVAIGRAIVREPKVFLFDEPLSNLDASLRQNMRIELSKLHKQLGTTMIYVTHDQVEAMTLADRIVLFNAGVVQQVGSPLALYDHPANLFVAGFLGAPKMNFLDAKLVTASATVAHLSLGNGSSVMALVNASHAALGSPVKLGIRPEYLRLAAADESAAIKANVSLIEHLGDQILVYLEVAGIQETLCMKLSDRNTTLAYGASVGLHLAPEHCLVFDHAGNAYPRLIQST